MTARLKILTKDDLCGKSEPPINQSRRRPPIEVTAFSNHCDYFGDYLKEYRYNHQDPED